MDSAEFLNRFSINLHNKLKEKGINSYQLAQRTGIAVRSINGYVNGYHMPNAYYIAVIAEALCCSTEDLIGLTELQGVCYV